MLKLVVLAMLAATPPRVPEVRSVPRMPPVIETKREFVPLPVAPTKRNVHCRCVPGNSCGCTKGEPCQCVGPPSNPTPIMQQHFEAQPLLQSNQIPQRQIFQEIRSFAQPMMQMRAPMIREQKC